MAVAGRMIVDAQVHLWKAESDDWKWVPGRKPQLPEPFTIEKLVPLMDEAGVDRAVIVPPSWPGDRNDYGLEAAKRYPNRFAVMGRIPLQNPESGDAPAEMAGAAGHGGHAADVHARAGGQLDQWRRRLVLARGREGRPAGHVLRPGQHAEVRADRRAASRAQSDHRPHEPHAGNRRRSGRIPRAIDDVVGLAKYPNVSVKLSSAPNFRWRPIRGAT